MYIHVCFAGVVEYVCTVCMHASCMCVCVYSCMYAFSFKSWEEFAIYLCRNFISSNLPTILILIRVRPSE